MENEKRQPGPTNEAERRAWTIRAMLSWCEGYLAKHHDPDPRASAQWLVGHATGLQKIELYLDLDRVLNSAELDFMRDAVRRRAKGEPLQYLTGSAPFRFITVEVEPGVLIPRPETEVLVSSLLDMLPKAPRRVATDSHPVDEIEEILANQAHAQSIAPSDNEDEDLTDAASVTGDDVGRSSSGNQMLQILEVGTGTGCIACALATERSDVEVTATDISPLAVDLARKNVRRLNVGDRVSVLECDLGAAIAPEAMGTFDALISNPPYIPTQVYQGLDIEVHDYEPRLALDGGADGLDFYRRLLPFAKDALKPAGAFCCELHEDCLSHAATLAEDAGFSDIAIIDDMAGRPRVLTARNAGSE
ncbi:MAG: N5-glutamine methyltransferase family protein [Eggerthellaceae bacterium]|jgi:release factor glutamine methyltransferase